jgi:hypothetical protein
MNTPLIDRTATTTPETLTRMRPGSPMISPEWIGSPPTQ